MENPLKKWLDWLSPNKGPESKPKLTKANYIVILACLGVLLLIINQFFSIDDRQAKDSAVNQTDEDQDSTVFLNKDSDDPLTELELTYQADLQGILEKISGVSNVEVMVNLDATSEQVFEKNLIVGTQSTVENDQGGGTRNIEDLTEEQQVVVVRQGDQEIPLIVQSKKPTVRGVLVVAEGVEQMQLKQWVTEAVSRVLDVPPHRISIMPRSEGEG
ncbi:stage III sporulation protein AG [Amphibacillus marinus]|uniref:Stage III sporulation protein AG n=1 Tax=Amphibacillus marinus TaxID=872970 RepID=A0A1H8NLE4_9BACI|nr:stage III sporulation protein AG [Amphibacillus marinus]SEO30435.1 stage III sporulation protein AG [Amphibacillus marinus]